MDTLKIGDMIIAVVAGGPADTSRIVVVRGIYAQDNGDGTIMVMTEHKQILARKPRPGHTVTIVDAGLTQREKSWVPDFRQHLSTLARCAFAIPGAGNFSDFLRARSHELLELSDESLFVISTERYGASWNIILDGNRLGTYTVWCGRNNDVEQSRWYRGFIPGQLDSVWLMWDRFPWNHYEQCGGTCDHKPRLCRQDSRNEIPFP